MKYIPFFDLFSLIFVFSVSLPLWSPKWAPIILKGYILSNKKSVENCLLKVIWVFSKWIHLSETASKCRLLWANCSIGSNGMRPPPEGVDQPEVSASLMVRTRGGEGIDSWWAPNERQCLLNFDRPKCFALLEVLKRLHGLSNLDKQPSLAQYLTHLRPSLMNGSSAGRQQQPKPTRSDYLEIPDKKQTNSLK